MSGCVVFFPGKFKLNGFKQKVLSNVALGDIQNSKTILNVILKYLNDTTNTIILQKKIMGKIQQAILKL